MNQIPRAFPADDKRGVIRPALFGKREIDPATHYFRDAVIHFVHRNEILAPQIRIRIVERVVQILLRITRRVALVHELLTEVSSSRVLAIELQD